MRKVAIGCDPNAAELKEAIKQHLTDLGYQYEDYGSEDPIYANVAFEVAEAVAIGKYDRGVLLCGTGIGMCLAANKVKGAYAATCMDPYSAERSVLSNNCNILTPAVIALEQSAEKGELLDEALAKFEAAAKSGMESTKDLQAKMGRASRLGERTIGHQDAGATSCYFILQAFAGVYRL